MRIIDDSGWRDPLTFISAGMTIFGIVLLVSEEAAVRIAGGAPGTGSFGAWLVAWRVPIGLALALGGGALGWKLQRGRRKGL